MEKCMLTLWIVAAVAVVVMVVASGGGVDTGGGLTGAYIDRLAAAVDGVAK